MLGRTHQLAAVGTALSAAILYPVETLNAETATLALLMAMVGGVTPDIDKPGTKLWANVPAGGCLSRLISPVFIGGHRHLTHSLVGLAIFGVIMRVILEALPLGAAIDITIIHAAFILGFASHIIADMLTKDGVPLLFPLPFHIGFPPFEFLRVRTNGMVEKLLVAPAVVVAVVVLAYLYRENTATLLALLGVE